jgi:hypothetical protein
LINIRLRILDYFDIESVFDPRIDEILEKHPDELSHFERAWRELWCIGTKYRDELDKAYFIGLGTSDDSASRTLSAIEHYLSLGYHWANAEAEARMKPLAISALRVKAGATSGGSKSGAVRRQKRAASWEPIARQMAKDIRADNPTFSQDDVAKEIDFTWQVKTCDPPGHSTLKGLVSRMELAGELPKRRRT